MHTWDTSVVARRESSARSYCRWFAPALQRAKGSLLWAREGRRHIDVFAGAGSLSYGHNGQDMEAALVDHIDGDGVAHIRGRCVEAGVFIETCGPRDEFPRRLLPLRGNGHRQVDTTAPA